MDRDLTGPSASGGKAQQEMSKLKGVRSVVFPARALAASRAVWIDRLDQPPADQHADSALFAGDVEIGLSRLPWVDHPLDFRQVDDIEGAHRALVAAGAGAMVEVADGSLAAGAGTPLAGITDVPGGRLAVLEAADGNLVGIGQGVPVDCSACSPCR